MKPRRMFWLDGGGARDWSGRRSIVGVLHDDDVSLTFDAAAREVRRHRSGRSKVVGDDVFEVLATEVARDAGDPDVHWVGYLGYACRTDLPGRPSPDVPDAVWMRIRAPRFVDHPPPGRVPGWSSGQPAPALDPGVVPRGVRPGAGASARRQLLRGQPDLPGEQVQRRRPGDGVPAAARGQPGAVRGLPAAPRRRSRRAPAQLLAGAVRHRRPAARPRGSPDQGHHAPRRDPRGRRATAAPPRPRTPSCARRT